MISVFCYTGNIIPQRMKRSTCTVVLCTNNSLCFLHPTRTFSSPNSGLNFPFSFFSRYFLSLSSALLCLCVRRESGDLAGAWVVCQKFRFLKMIDRKALKIFPSPQWSGLHTLCSNGKWESALQIEKIAET